MVAQQNLLCKDKGEGILRNSFLDNCQSAFEPFRRECDCSAFLLNSHEHDFLVVFDICGAVLKFTRIPS